METSLEQQKSFVKKNVVKKPTVFDNKPTPAFIGASWTALGVGMIAFCVGLWNAERRLMECRNGIE